MNVPTKIEATVRLFPHNNISIPPRMSTLFRIPGRQLDSTLLVDVVDVVVTDKKFLLFTRKIDIVHDCSDYVN